MAAGNRPLVCFSLYTLLLNLGLFSPVGVMLLRLKTVYQMPENELLLVSGAIIAGPAAGYAMAAVLERVFGKWKLLLLIHILGLAALLGLLFVTPDVLSGKIVATFLLMVITFVIAVNSVTAGAVMMSLANPGNKSLAMAFWGCFYYGGGGLSRLLASLLAAGSVYHEKMPLWLSCGFITAAFIPFLLQRDFKHTPER